MKAIAIDGEIFIRITDKEGKLMTFAEIEKNVIEYFLERCDWNKSDAARRLGLGRATIYRKIAQ